MSQHKFNFGEQRIDVRFEKFPNLQTIDFDRRKILNDEIHSLLANCWGKFPENFVEKHIFGANKMITARIQNKCIGICVMSLRQVLGKKIHYIEFLLVNRDFQKYGLGSFLSFMTIREEIFRNLAYILVGKPLEIFFITPNIRVLSHMAKFASFIYPNPYLSDQYGQIESANDETWTIANELLIKSDNPNRILERNGLVLSGSYAETPWLIYNNDTAPWHNNEKMNIFARKYLGYHNGADREFMVRAHVNIVSLLRYLFHMIK